VVLTGVALLAVAATVVSAAKGCGWWEGLGYTIGGLFAAVGAAAMALVAVVGVVVVFIFMAAPGAAGGSGPPPPGTREPLPVGGVGRLSLAIVYPASGARCAASSCRLLGPLGYSRDRPRAGRRTPRIAVRTLGFRSRPRPTPATKTKTPTCWAAPASRPYGANSARPGPHGRRPEGCGGRPLPVSSR
jgi:hypothetical protein